MDKFRAGYQVALEDVLNALADGGERSAAEWIKDNGASGALRVGAQAVIDRLDREMLEGER